MSDSYARRGVSASKEDVHFAIRRFDAGLYPNAFCKVLPDLAAGDPAFCTLMHADGAGTKSALAYLYWRETGDLSVWRGIMEDAIVMNLDDMLCAGATGDFMMSSTIGRNKFLIPKEVLAELLDGAAEFAERMQAYGIRIVNAGGETADLGDVVRTLVVDATMFCRFPRSEVISNEGFQPGDVIVGLASSGQAVYETAYNSGIGSNGLTNARHDSLAHSYADAYPESFDPGVERGLVYSGKLRLTDPVDGAPLDAGRLLLSPTRTYLPLMREVLARHRSRIHGLIHCTGGGQTKCLKFTGNLHVVKDQLFTPPPVFRMIQENSGAGLRDMYRVFNMGHRLEIYTDPRTASDIIQLAASYGIEAQGIGYTAPAASPRLSLHTPEGIFEYEPG
jgi:phosphoribosylformylglycinamidine cyclo-ligase